MFYIPESIVAISNQRFALIQLGWYVIPATFTSLHCLRIDNSHEMRGGGGGLYDFCK